MIWDVDEYLILWEPPVPVITRSPLVKDGAYIDLLNEKWERRKARQRDAWRRKTGTQG